MGIFDRLFGRTPNPESRSNTPASSSRQGTGASAVRSSLYDSSHPAASDIAEAEGLATSLVAQGRYGVGSVEMQDVFDVRARIKQPIDAAIERAPTDPDLLYARASLHYLCLQGEDGKRDREQCLALDPNHFDALQMGAHSASWKTPFHLPHWDVDQATLPGQVAERLSVGQNLQLVRDHLRTAVAIFCPEDVVTFEGCSKVRWDLHWVKTPAGHVAAHYVHLDTNKFAEFFLPHLAGGDARLDQGYWQLRRLGQEDYCFVVATRGNKVTWNSRYRFPAALRTKLANMAKDLAANGPIASAQQSRAAAQWHMDNSDPSILKY